MRDKRATFLGLTGGDFCHALLHPGQMREQRPIHGWSDYHVTPVEGLYMCGASCHSRPDITRTPGYNRARKALENC